MRRFSMTDDFEQNISQLLNGIALFIDNEVDAPHTNAKLLKEQIQSKNIPLITYQKIPENSNSFVDNLHGVSFIILDWIFIPLDEKARTAGVELPKEVIEEDIQNTVSFLKLLLNKTYCPIFIFSEVEKEEIYKMRNRQV